MRGVRVVGAAFAALFAVVCLPQAFATPADENTILPDPNVHVGVLPNGMRFAIMKNATPTGAVSLRLAVDVGSFEENPGEYGVAHFLEHMAFSGGQNARETGPEKAFAKAGVSFGRDVNAFTTLFYTQYRLDLPSNDDGSLTLAFNWLRTVADGAKFSEDAVDRERDVILSERAYRMTPQYAAEEASDQFQMPGLRSTRKDMMGSVDDLRAIHGKDLLSFYKRWYRPQNAVVIVVGDVDPAVLEKRIRTQFASWKGEGPAPARPAYGAPDETRGLDATAYSDARLSPSIGVCRTRKPDPRGPDDVARLKQETLTLAWTNILNGRLSALTKTGRAPFLAAQMVQSKEYREVEQSCAIAALVDADWQKALRALAPELREFAGSGPTEAELDGAIDAMRSAYRGILDTAATRKSSDLADAVMKAELNGDVMRSPSEGFRAFDVAVENIRPDDVRGQFLRDWSGAGPLIVLIAPSASSGDAIRQAWTDDQSAPLETPSASEKLVWGYDSFGAAGRVAGREAIDNPGFTRITFSNGIALNFKHTDFEQGMVKVRVVFGAGRREIPNQDLLAAELGAEIFALGGTGKHDVADIQQLFAQQSWDAKLSVRSNAFILDGSTTSTGLKLQLQILAAYISDPGFRSTLDSRIPTVIDLFYRDARSDPPKVLGFTLADAIAPHGPGSLPPEAKLVNLRMRDFERLLKPALSKAPLEVTVVGDVDEATASELVGETFGALPERSNTPRERAETEFLRFPDHDLATIRTTYEGGAGVAVVGAIWPLYVAVPERRREEVALTLLSDIFTNELRDRVRQQLGKSYSPEVGLETPDRSDQGFMMAEVETSPGDTETIIAEVRRLAQTFASGNLTQDELEAARRPYLAALETRAKSNDWWVAGISEAGRTRDGLDEMHALPELARAVTLDEVRKAAADWLNRAPLVIVATPSGNTSPPPTAQR